MPVTPVATPAHPPAPKRHKQTPRPLPAALVRLLRWLLFTDQVKARRSPNLRTIAFPELTWDGDDAVRGPLLHLYRYATFVGEDAISWYFRKKRWKARIGRLLRFLAIFLTTAGGLLPFVVASGLFNDTDDRFKWSQLGYILLALAGGCVLLDKFFGFSSAWVRYVTTALALQRHLARFQFDWATLIVDPKSAEMPPPCPPDQPPAGAAAAGPSPPHGTSPAPLPTHSPSPWPSPAPSPLPAAAISVTGGTTTLTTAQRNALLRRLAEFVLQVRQVVEEETAEWATEYRSNLTDIERTATRRQAVDTAGMKGDPPATPR